MQTRTYTERKNAKRAAIAAGIDVSTITEGEDGFTVHFVDRDNSERGASDIKLAVDAAIERGLTPKQFVQEAEKVADALDAIPDFCKIDAAKRKESWDKNPPRAAAPAKPKEITMPKAKAKKPKGQTGAEKTATLLKMLAGKGSTVDAMCKKLEWLPHSLRARICRLPKPKNKGGEGIKIARERVAGVTTYRIAT